MVATTLDVGLGVREVLAAPSHGVVVGVYRVAAYLRFPAGLVALTSGLAPRGPLHLRVAVLPELRAGERVSGDGTTLRGTTWSASLAAPTWTGALPTGSHTPPGGGTQLRTCVPPRGPVCELYELAARLGGRGSGLTPEGDDVLAGALLAVRAAHGPTGEPGLRDVAASVRTTEVAAAFLAWAARGQCIEPAHDWLLAPDTSARDRAERRLLAIGASSGAALLAGLRLGTGQASGSDIQIARVGPGPELDQLCGRSVG
ncbi:oxamate carbamoyltransferase subunit AllH family protein [Pseudonocardia saturnea]